LENGNLGTWANSTSISKESNKAGMDSGQLWNTVMSQAGDKSEPTSVADDTNVPVQQDADQEPKLVFETA